MNGVRAGRMSDASVKNMVRDTFNLAASSFGTPPLFFWDLFGRRTVELAPVRADDRVLDVCCGTGASAVPAAAIAGTDGSVVGIDLAEQLLNLAKEKALKQGLRNVEFRIG